MKRISAILLIMVLLVGIMPSTWVSVAAQSDAIVLDAKLLVKKGSAIRGEWELGEFDGQECAVFKGAPGETTGAPVIQYVFREEMDLSKYRYLVIDYYRTGDFNAMNIKLRTQINGGTNTVCSLVNINDSWHKTVYEVRGETATFENLLWFQYKPFGESSSLEKTSNARFYVKSIGFYKENPLVGEERERQDVLQKEFDEKNALFIGEKGEHADFSELDGYERTGELLNDPSFENMQDVAKKSTSFENIIPDSSFEGTLSPNWYIPGGKGELVQVDGGTTGSKSLKITKREVNTNSIACDVRDILTKYGQGIYKMRVNFKTDKGSPSVGNKYYLSAKLKGSLDASQSWQGIETKIAADWITHENTFVAMWNGDLKTALIYLEGSNKADLYDYYVDDFELYKISDVVTDENDTSWRLTSDSSVLTKVEGDAHDGKYAVKISERADVSTGVAQNITKALNENGPGMYSVSAHIKTDSKAMSIDKPYIIYLRVASDGGTSIEKRIDYYMDETWGKIYFVFDLQWSGKVTNALFCVRGYDTTDKTDFYVDDCSMFKYIKKSDIKEKHTMYMQGYSDSTFKPENSITRAEAAHIVARLIADVDSLEGNFVCKYKDIPQDEWYSKSVTVLSGIGLLDDFKGDYFMPDKPITRAEMAMLVDKICLKPAAENNNISFRDINNNPFAESIIRAAKRGIINGYSDGTFRPDMNVTRAEAVVMINRALGRNVTKGAFFGIKLNKFTDVTEDHWAYTQIVEATNDHSATLYDKGNDVWDETWKITKDTYDKELANSVVAELDVRTEALRQEILNASDNMTVTGTKYYVSASGNDENSGLSPDEPWATIDKVNNFKFKNGDGVFFKRGDRWWGVQMILQSGVTYAAYGSGNKPELFGTARNYADPSCWKQTEIPNVWETVDEIASTAGFIWLDGTYTYKVNSNDELKKNFDFFDLLYDASPVRIYYDGGNPGSAFETIYIAPGTSVINAPTCSDVYVDNLAVKFTGWHGFQTSNVKNFHVSNCEVGWIGGAGNSSRWGNGIEFWSNASNCSIDHCWVYQTYDTGLTNQGNGVQDEIIVEEDISYTNNLVEYCSYSFEFFTNQSNSNNDIMKNITIANNISRYCGYGWGNNNRPTKDTQNQLKGWVSKNRCENFVIRDNWFDEARYGTFDYGARPLNLNYKTYFVVLPQYRLTFDNNTYIEKVGDDCGEHVGIKYKFGYDLHSEFIRDNLDKNARIVLIEK